MEITKGDFKVLRCPHCHSVDMRFYARQAECDDCGHVAPRLAFVHDETLDAVLTGEKQVNEVIPKFKVIGNERNIYQGVYV